MVLANQIFKYTFYHRLIEFYTKINECEDDLIKNCQGFTALINQYAPFTEKVFKELPDLKMVVR